MAVYNNIKVTDAGVELLRDVSTLKRALTAAGAVTSESIISDVAAATTIPNVKQNQDYSLYPSGKNQLVLEVQLTNAGVDAQYTLNTVGFYANDGVNGNVLFAVVTAQTPDTIPPETAYPININFKEYILLDTSGEVIINASFAGYASQEDFFNHVNDNNEEFEQLHAQVDDVQSFIGYTDNDIFGLEVDFANKKFTRLAGASDKEAGVDFDDVKCFGGRKRCIVTDAGIILAYYGEPGYTETGKLTVALTVNEAVYAVGTTVQVMVYQPRFFYRVVPLVTEKIVDGKGYHMRKARYYVSATPKTGFKLHPAFIKNGEEKNYVLIGAYEACLYDVSAANYITDDSQIGDFASGTGDKLSSIANVKPVSGITHNLIRRNCGVAAENRGAGWSQLYGAIASATQMLMLIELGTFNTQNAVGRGVCDFASGTGNESILTGGTASFGNLTGMAAGTDGFVSVTYRGQENPWGNIWEFVDGFNIEAWGKNELWIADNNFADSAGLPAPNGYVNAGITLAKVNGYVSAMAYNEPFDWLFFASETVGDSNLPVGDNFWQNNPATNFLIARLGASWGVGANAGGFAWSVDTAVSNRSRTVGGRVVYVP